MRPETSTITAFWRCPELCFLLTIIEPQQITDPAGRLIAILQADLQAKSGHSYLQFWATAFKVYVKNPVGIYYNLCLLRLLVDDVENAIK
jgi:hypothetical protein